MSDLLRQTIRDLPPMLAQTTGLGQGDWKDAYTAIDYMAFAFERAYPTQPCRSGCAHCCRTQLFRVSRAEWEPLRQALAVEPARLASLLDRTRSAYAPHREALERLALHWTSQEPSPSLQDVPVVCPLLEDERCSAYEARPAICRGYGSFGARIEGREVLLMCQENGPDFVRRLAESGQPFLMLPPWGPVEDRIAQLNPTGEVAPLPLWLLRLADEHSA